MIRTYNEYHLGDQLIHLNYLRRLGLPATHYCKAEYHKQLQPLVLGTDIVLMDLPAKPEDAVNAWIGADNYFYNHPMKKHWVEFHLDWFEHLSNTLGVTIVMVSQDDFLFDYSALMAIQAEQYDYLIINSPPKSNQLPSFNQDAFKRMAQELLDQGHTVISTYPLQICPNTLEKGLDVTQIGILSKAVQHIIAVDTGPLWTTYNVHNKGKVLSRTVYHKFMKTGMLNTDYRQELI